MIDHHEALADEEDAHGAFLVAPDVWRLGKRDEHGFHLGHHSYLLRLLADETSSCRGADYQPAQWVWVDPGNADQLATNESQVHDLIGSRDVPLLLVATGLGEQSVGALPTVLGSFPRALLLTNFETWNFLSVTEVAEERVRLVERYRPGLRFPEVGRSLHVIANPYGQFTGALLLFEPRSGCLLSGDLLAGEPGDHHRPDPWAVAIDWPLVRRLQEQRMPCNAALRWTLGRMRQLEGLRKVCPQSGPLLRGPVLHRFAARLEELPVGADLLEPEPAVADGPGLELM